MLTLGKFQPLLEYAFAYGNLAYRAFAYRTKEVGVKKYILVFKSKKLPSIQLRYKQFLTNTKIWCSCGSMSVFYVLIYAQRTFGATDTASTNKKTLNKRPSYFANQILGSRLNSLAAFEYSKCNSLLVVRPTNLRPIFARR
jgi:hypothetical protein